MDKFFKDKHGKWAVWQTPNALLVTWFGAMVLASILTGGRLDRLVEAVAFGALFAWAWTEMLKGDSYFRRVLGFVVLVMIVISRSR